MSRISLMVAVAVAAGVVGCAQCDTCDDFPAPCNGPNCGQNHAMQPGLVAPTMDQGMPIPGPSGPMAAPGNDSAPAMPDAPATPSPTAPPAGDSTSPPMPSEPGRPGV